jgi:hypothetical protein
VRAVLFQDRAKFLKCDFLLDHEPVTIIGKYFRLGDSSEIVIHYAPYVVGFHFFGWVNEGFQVSIYSLFQVNIKLKVFNVIEF